MENYNPFASSKSPLEYNQFYWFNRLWNIAVSFRSWKGGPFNGPRKTCDSEYFNSVLLGRGEGILIKDNSSGNIYAVPCAIEERNYFLHPVKVRVDVARLPSLKGIVGENVIYVKNNKNGTSAIGTITYYASLLGEIQTSLNVNLLTCRSSKLWRANDSGQAEKIRRTITDIKNGKIGILADDSLVKSIIDDSSGRVPLISNPSDYLVDKYCLNIRNVLNEFLTVMGIDVSGANMIKAERNVSDEVHCNDEEIALNRSFWLDDIISSAKDASELFNTKIECEYAVAKNEDAPMTREEDERLSPAGAEKEEKEEEEGRDS